VNVYPILLDSSLPYAGGAPAASLLQLPLGTGTVLSHIRGRLGPVISQRPTVFSSVAGDESAYRAALGEVDPSLECGVGPDAFRTRLERYEPSDALLIVDPRCMPLTGLDPQSLLRHPVTDSRWARHLVALERSPDGMRECVEFDAVGRVRRIQRFYETVTWPFTDGVSCSLVPAATALLPGDLPWSSLAEMRRALASRGIPGRDLPMRGPVVHLDVEAEMLALSEHVVAETFSEERRSRREAVLYVGTGHEVDRSARVVGPVILHGGVTIEEGATVLGPAVIGAGARVGRGALVAQGLLAAGALVPAGGSASHQVVFGTHSAEAAEARRAYSVRTVPLPLLPGPPRPPLYARVKPVVESLLAVAALVLLSPLLALISAIIKLESRGPVFYGHKREGKDGRQFHCWKFRTMEQGAQARERELQGRNQVDGPQFKLGDDPRITQVGRWLRPTSLDELPQLINVAVGEMSLVGPRPSPFRENQYCVPWREGRLSVRPGITGLWQVCRHDRSAGDFHQWILYDLLYVRYVSFATDIKILVATIITGGGKGHVPLSWILSEDVIGDQV